MKATEQHFPVVLFIVLCKVVLSFESVDKILKPSVTIQMKATEQYFSLTFSGFFEVKLQENLRTCSRKMKG